MTHDAGAEAERELLRDVLRRSTWDQEFRERLLNEPKRALEEEYGLELPPDFVLRFIEKEEGVDAVVVLPDLEAEQELTDEELDTVAGGQRGYEDWGGSGDGG